MLHPIVPIHPLELVHIDFLTIKSDNTDKWINVLVISDHFMCYKQAFVSLSNC